MARIRKITLQNFRSIKDLVWQPARGLNCLIGPGDSGKSTVLDAIDWCLGSRRSLPVTDADFHTMNTDEAIVIEVVLGDLGDGLKSIDSYGNYLRGLNDKGEIEDEPGAGLETVLCVGLTIGNDLEPQWTLVSTRAEEQGLSRDLSWSDRSSVAPNRIGVFATQDLGWQKGSILNRVSEDNADTSLELAKVSREARNNFGDHPGDNAEHIGW